MGAEIYDVIISIDNIRVLYATKVNSKRNKDTKTTLTFNGDVNTGGANTGGTITVEGLYWPNSIDEAIALENKLNSDEPITTLTCEGKAYTANGDSYTRIINGTKNVVVANDEDEWSPTDGITQKLEFNVDVLTRTAK